MEDIQQYNFTVKSNIHDYEVQFIDNVKTTLSKTMKKGDFIIIDNKVKNLYPKWFEEALNLHPKQYSLYLVLSLCVTIQ